MTQLKTRSAVRATTGSGNNTYLVLLEARITRALRLGDLALVDEVELDLCRADSVGGKRTVKT